MNWLFLLKKKTQTTEPPQNNNNTKPQECGLSLRHLITGALTNWREFRGKQGEKKKPSEGSNYPQREAGG